MTPSSRSNATSILLRGALLASVVALAAPAVEAAQRVHFKNGHVLVVDKAREEGDTVYLKLRDGSEVGFPKSLIAEIETKSGVRAPVRRSHNPNSVRGPGLGDLAPAPGSTTASRKTGERTIKDSGFDREKNPNYAGPVMMGYGRYGSSLRNRGKGPGTEQMSLRQARRMKERERASGPVADPANPGETPGTAIGQPKLARPTTRESGQPTSDKR